MTSEPEVAGAELLGRRVAHGIGQLWVVRAVAIILQFVAFTLTAAHLGPEEVGIYAFALAFAELFRFVPDFGIGQVAARDIAQHPEREAELIPNVIMTRFAMGAFAYVALFAGLHAIGYSETRRAAALVAGTSLLLLSITSAQIVMQVRLQLGSLAAADALKAAIIFAGTFVLVHADGGVVAFVWLYIAASTSAGILLLIVALRVGRLRWRFRPDIVRRLIRDAAPLALGIFFIALYYRLDMAILARLKPASDLGQYGVAYRFLETFVVLPTLAITVLAPVLARSFLQGRDVLQRRLREALRFGAVVSVPVAIGGALTAWRVLPELPGLDSYEGAGTTLSILAPAAALIFFGMIIQSVLINAHLQHRLLGIAAVGLAVNVILNAALIPPYSYVGAAVATTATELFLLALSIREVHRRIGINSIPARLAKILIANAIFAAALLAGFATNPLIQVGTATVVYAIATLGLGAVTRSDLALFTRSRSGNGMGSAASAPGSP